MPSFEYAEFVLFLILFFGYLPVIFIYKSYRQTRLFFFAYTILLIGVLASNLEAFHWSKGWDIIEHGLGVGLAGVLFLLYAYRSYRETVFLRKKLEEMEE